ncbi:hypothetical protein AX774_g7705 [Zancudomyces culisetae]|uniref:Uncharacterized protein n=1 Tax=Zancudomyces culisetae TaxID=1213189 RepID=A0A1R1PD59_ZANCU|nr:hypothetical protein AX774_g7705 [Zancudomyces culisetae]|eukprot:OMH78896.1 hypothetical protein AX774_g7705 [Zancudomyces culisetae]
MNRRCMVDPMKQWVGWYNRTVQEFLSKLKALLKSYNLSAAQCGNIIRVLNSRENKSDQRWQSVVDDLKGILLELEGQVPGVDISGIDLQLYSLVSNEIAGYVGTTVSDGLKYGVYEYPVQTIESWIASLAERNPSVSMGGSLFIGGRRGSGLALGTGSVSRTKTQWGGGMDMGNLSWRISFVEEDSADLGMHKTTKQKEYDSLVALKRAVSKLIDHYPPHLKGLFKAFHGQCDTILEDCSWFDNHLRSFERPNPGSGETGNGIMYRYLNPNYLQTGQTLYFTLAQQLAEKLKEYTGVIVSKSQGKLKFALSIGNSSTPYPLYHTTENLAVLLSIGHFAYLVLESVATLLISDQKLSNTGVVTAESVEKLSQNLNSITISCFEPLITLYTDSFISNYERIVKSLYPAFFADQRLDEKAEVWRNVELYVDNNIRKDGDFAQQDFFPVMDTHTSLYSSLGDVDFVYQPESKQDMQNEEIDPCGGLEPSPALVYLLTLLLSDSRSKLYKLSAELTASLINSLFKQISRRIDTLFSSIFLPSLEPTNEKQDNLTTSVRSGSADETGSFDATNGAVHAHYSHSSNRCYQVLQLVVDLQYLNRFFLSNTITTPDTNTGENPDAPKQALFFSTTISGIQDYVKTDENQHHQSCYFCSLSANVLASF